MIIQFNDEIDEFGSHKNRIFICNMCGKRVKYIPNEYGMPERWSSFWSSSFSYGQENVDFCSSKCELKWMFWYKLRTKPFPVMFRILLNKILRS